MTQTDNPTAEQKARVNIDRMLRASGWEIQNRKEMNLFEHLGVAVREYPTETGPADYVLFLEGTPVGIIEAKKEEEGYHLTKVEEQSGGYAHAKLRHLNNSPLPFVYESTGIITRFTNLRDPKPKARDIFSFHRPEFLKDELKSPKSLRGFLHDIPLLDYDGLRQCQTSAITQLEESFKANKPRALIHMATGAGKTFTAITFIYRLLKFAKARRVLFLVDTKNLGEQAEQEFCAYTPADDGRKFPEIYTLTRLSSSFVPTDSQVVISTIQRMYSILRGEELDESDELTNPSEPEWRRPEPLPVVYNEKIPLEFFDFIVIDECHRSIYNLWRQVLDYFDAFQIGLTATPDARTYGYFQENVVSEYTYEKSVVDGVNVGFDVFLIETEISKHGGRIEAKEWVDKREKLTRKKRWEQLDEEFEYDRKKLDRAVVNPSQIRHVIRAFKDALPAIFPHRQEVPKTLVFAKTDSHADDIIQVIRDEFDEGNDFCKKVTYQTKEDPKTILSQFRNQYNPRIAVTVDMIATGTDVKPLECLLFMRDVKSLGYFEQMKGRGTRSIKKDDLLKVTSSATQGKSHFVIVDAVGVTQSRKTDSRPLERDRSIPTKELLDAVVAGAKSEDLFTSLAWRMIRLSKEMSEPEIEQFQQLSGRDIHDVCGSLLAAYDPDEIVQQARQKDASIREENIAHEQFHDAQEELIREAQKGFTGELAEYVENVRRVHEQIIDTVNIDQVTFSGWDQQAQEKAKELITEFETYLADNKDQIVALSFFYSQPHRLKELTYDMLQSVVENIKANRPHLAPERIWEVYARFDQVEGRPRSELTALVSLLRRITGMDDKLTAFSEIVNRRFQEWAFKKHAGDATKFNEEQMAWLHMLRDHISTSFHIERDDLDNEPFGERGGLGRMYQLFGAQMEQIIDEMNEELVA